jgi:hypothetical protein
MTSESQKIYENLSPQTRDIYAKYDESFQFLQRRKKRQVNQLVLLNNLQRGDENIASTLLLTLFNRIMSNLYDDKMQVKFVPSEELDQKKVNSLNILAQNDYREMNKSQLDYDWVWDTLFFGRGYMETLRFNKQRKIMEPAVINPLVFGYDPFFEDPQQWRYYWKWITKSSVEVNKLIKQGVIKGISSAKDIPSGIDPFLWDYKVRREEAKLVTPQANDTYQGDVHQILEFFGYNEDGEKCIYWLDRDFSKILYYEVLDLRDAEDGKSSLWPIVVKEAFREPHASVVFSVADLLEDKHRARSVLLNLSFIAAKDKANPIYWYDPNKVQDVTQLFSRQINQHIPVEGPGDLAIGPLNKDSAMDPSLQVFMQTLNQEANDPIGTGMALAPARGGDQTATEAAIQQQLNDLAQSLQSKVLQFGESDFWSHWYNRYKRYMRSGDEKMATIVGVKGVTFEKIDLGDINTKYPPGVLVFSAKEAEYKELVLRRDMMQMYPQLITALGPDGMRNFNKYVFFPKFLNDPQMMDILVPKTIDEVKAEEENEAINENSLPDVHETDMHTEHLPIHYMAKNTWAKWVHIAWHEELLGKQKQQQMMQQMAQPMAQSQQEGSLEGVPAQPGAGLTGAEQGNLKSPLSAASSLRDETMKSIKQNKPL